MLCSIHNKCFDHDRGAAMLGRLVSVAVLAALLLVFGVHSGGARQADAADPNLEFEMDVVGGTPSGGGGCTTVGTTPTQKGDAVCSVLVNGSFTVVVRLADPGSFSGQVISVQAVVGWTAGLIGPGDSGSSKEIRVLNCRGFEATSGNFLNLGRVAGAGCSSFPPPLTDAEAIGIRAEFEMNCGAAPSQELITMMDEALPGKPQTGTSIEAGGISFADKDGNEVITIRCATEAPGLPGVAVGGFSTDLDGGGLALETARASGGRVDFLIALLAVAAVSAVALAGAGWYARRRWLDAR